MQTLLESAPEKNGRTGARLSRQAFLRQVGRLAITGFPGTNGAVGLSLGKNLGRAIAICRIGGWLAQGWGSMFTQPIQWTSVQFLYSANAGTRSMQNVALRGSWLL